MFESILSFFTSPPRQGAAPLGAGLSGADDDPVLPAFQSAWKDGALIEDMFGPEPFKLHGSVGRTGADNHRPDVAKVETLLGDAGYYRPMTSAGPDGWHNPALDQSIRSFQKDKGLLVDGLLKPNGPTITAIGGLFGGGGKSNSQTVPPPAQPDRFPGHTISPQGARAHEDWAKHLPRDSKPEETARILAGTIKEHGDQGLADAADLLGRFVRHDPAKAENLRRLVSGQAGRDVPLRIAPVGEGFVAPSQEEKLARAPKQPFGPADGADLDAAASMAKALLKVGDYKNAYGYFKTAAEATPPYMAAVHDFMRRENPALAMKFAEQGVEAGMVKAPEAPLAGQKPGTPLPPHTPTTEAEKSKWDKLRASLPPPLGQTLEGMGQVAGTALQWLSPGADIKDAVEASGKTTEAVKQGDPWGAAGNAADMLASMAGVVLPGTIKGYKEAAKTATEGAENAIRRTLPDVSKTENPISVKEFAQLPDTGSIDPKRIRTMQDSVASNFRDQRSLEETIESLRSGKIKPEDIPPIRIGEINGEIYTLDHRRLVAFREAGLPIRYQKATKRELEEESRRKMKTRSDGNHINIRKGEFK